MEPDVEIRIYNDKNSTNSAKPHYRDIENKSPEE